MPDTKLASLTALTSAVVGDYVEILDVSDTTMGAGGTNKKITLANLLLGGGAYVSGGTDVAIADGGTGSGTASGARTALGLAIGTDVFTQRTITGTANRVAVTNGDGTGGNPTLDVGSNVYTSGGTDVAVADGGTGSSTAANARTALGVPQDVNPGWANYTPTIANFTTGNGSVFGRWIQIGKLVTFMAGFIFGSSSAVGAGAVTVSLPATATTPSGTLGVVAIGDASYYDSSALTNYDGAIDMLTTTTCQCRSVSYDGSSAGVAYAKRGNVVTAVPMTWATGDELHVHGSYEAA